MAVSKPNIAQRAFAGISNFFNPKPTWERSAAQALTRHEPVTAMAETERWNHVVSTSFDGEKNWGEMGPAKDVQINYQRARIRAHEANVTNETANTIIKKLVRWIVSGGLKLQSNPDDIVLRSEGVTISKEAFNEITERRFALYCADHESTYSGNLTLHEQTEIVFQEATLTGDVLVVMRYENGILKQEIIDGAFVCSPMGNNIAGKIKHGVELDERGRHVAFHVKRQKPGDLSYEWIRIPAYSTAIPGMRTAWMVYGNRVRINDTRGASTIMVILESLAKLEAYKGAVVASAEEVAKIAYQIIHEVFSTGESPIIDQMAKIVAADNGTVATDADYDKLLKTIAVTTGKQTYNMPKGAKIETIDYKGTLNFKEFSEAIADGASAAADIPPNVVFSKYNDSFSASRAATMDFGHRIDIGRGSLATQHLNRVYEFWLYIEVMMGKIAAPGLLGFYKTKNRMGIKAYTACRFTGPKFPHIDPLKEVKAAREKLGPLFAHVPLCTVEQATEDLMGGDSDSNIMQAGEELRFSEQQGLKAVPVQTAQRSQKYGNADGEEIED